MTGQQERLSSPGRLGGRDGCEIDAFDVHEKGEGLAEHSRFHSGGILMHRFRLDCSRVSGSVAGAIQASQKLE